MKIQTENIAFSQDQMVECPKCGKPNPPNRTSCLYCVAAIEVPEGKTGGIKLNLRKLESWENGFNIVLLSKAENADVAAGSRYLKYETEMFERMLAAKDPFPILRIESEKDAELAVEHLASLGFSVRVVRDIELKIGKPCTRLRSVEFMENGVRFTAFNTNEQRLFRSDEIRLIVVGKIVESKLESVERKKKDKRKVLSETTTSSDDIVVDVYTADSEQGWRITTKGFDFSTLGNEKSLLAVENIRSLLERLKDLSPAAARAEDYPDIVAPLSEVWDIERRTDFHGLKRTGVWKSGYSSVARTSNLDQFSRYSRLQRLLI